jgi:hypothetical protein
VSWIKEDVESGQVPAPEEGLYLVLFQQMGVTKSFCGQYHAAMYFMPPGYDVTKKKVVQVPAVEVVKHEPIAQADGAGPEEVLCNCGHPVNEHNNWGCCVTLSDTIGDFCKCENQGPLV